MIRLDQVGKSYGTRSGARTVLREVCLELARGEKIGILGRNGAGKSTLIRLISGADRPTSGRIERQMKVSWPLAFGGAFQGSLSGLDNFKFICRIYGVDHRDKIEFVQDFAEIGRYFREPVKNYSSGMRSRLAFAVSMAVEFDCFLIDEIIAVGDSRFHDKCRVELFEKRSDRAMIIVSHQSKTIKSHCTRASVLADSRLVNYAGLDAAFEHYESMQ